MALWKTKGEQKSSIPPVLSVGSMLEFYASAQKGAGMGQKGGENGQNTRLMAVFDRFCQERE